MFGLNLGKLGSAMRKIAWNPKKLWPTGTEPGMWIDPSTLPASFNDYTGTTPVATPGSVADSANPVGLALDIRAGAPDTLGPELLDRPADAMAANWTDAGGGAYASAGSGYLEWYGLTASKTYLLSFRITSISAGALGEVNTIQVKSAVGTYSGYVRGVTGLGFYANGFTGVADSFSAREIPGNHLLQATSTARPLVSARVNQYQYTEDPSNAVWTKDAVTYSSTSDPAGGNTGIRLSADAVAGSHAFVVQAGGIFWGAIRPGATYTLTFRVRANGISKAMLVGNVYNGTGYLSGIFDLATGEVHSFVNCAPSIKPIGNGWFEISISGTANSILGAPIGIYMLNDAWSSSFTGNGVDGIDIWHPQFEFGLTATPYQSVPGDGSTYTSTGFPIYQKYDGTDDGMATASFAAGTLSNDMDCLIAVRRDSSALPEIYGLYQADRTRFFGVTSEYSPNGNTSVGGCGTPTVWCDGVQLPGGTAVDRGAMNDALTIGSWHILEFRGLDLSAWNSVCFGGYATYCVNGAQGGILLFPGGDTAGRDQARAWLAAKVGVTLP